MKVSIKIREFIKDEVDVYLDCDVNRPICPGCKYEVFCDTALRLFQRDVKTLKKLFRKLCGKGGGVR